MFRVHMFGMDNIRERDKAESADVVGVQCAIIGCGVIVLWMGHEIVLPGRSGRLASPAACDG
jgi:hypothetical protein